MKKKNYFYSVFAIMMAAMLSVGFTACGGDDGGDTPTPPTPILKVNGVPSASLEFEGSFNGKSGIDFKQTVTITSNVSWTVSGVPNWLSVSPINGSGDLQISIYPLNENSSLDERNATITISGDGASATISITQHSPYDKELSVSPKQIVILSDGFAFDFTYGSKVKYYYVTRYLAKALERKTDDEIIAEMSSNSSDRDTPSDSYVTSWQNQSPLTDYVICTVGYDQNGKHGALTKTPITTKKGTNQALADIIDVQYNDTYWYWTTTTNGFVSKYYMWFISNTNLFNSTDAAIAWFFDQAMKENPSDFSPIAQGDTWQKARNGGTTFHVATWALDVDGNFSGVIGRFGGTISSASSKSIQQNYVEIPDDSKRFKTLK